MTGAEQLSREIRCCHRELLYPGMALEGLPVPADSSPSAAAAPLGEHPAREQPVAALGAAGAGACRGIPQQQSPRACAGAGEHPQGDSSPTGACEGSAPPVITGS